MASTVRSQKKKMTNFEKGAIVAELLSDDFEMVETEDAQFQKHSMQDLDKVLDTIQLSSNEMARLKQIIEASK